MGSASRAGGLVLGKGEGEEGERSEGEGLASNSRSPMAFDFCTAVCVGLEGEPCSPARGWRDAKLSGSTQSNKAPAFI